MEEKSDLVKLKEKYSVLKKEYSLPDFDDLNKDFHIEKISEEETDFLIREIRRYVGEKIANYARLIESLLHPVNSSMFVFSIIKVLREEDKKELQEMYSILAKEQIKIIKLDTSYSRDLEASFIRDFFKIWLNIKSKLFEIFSLIEENFDNHVEDTDKGYYG